MRTVHGEGEEKVICTVCGKGFATLYIAQTHEETCQGTANGQEMSKKKEEKMDFQCPECPKRFAGKGPMRKHIQNHHREKVRSFACSRDGCGKAFCDEGALRKHELTHGEKKIPCDICGEKFRDMANVKKHRMRHTGERPNVCPYCNHGCIQIGVLKSHILKIHKVVVPKGMSIEKFRETLSKEDSAPVQTDE